MNNSGTDREEARGAADRSSPQRSAQDAIGDLATGGAPEAATGPEVDQEGSDPESNVTGRSKPASDGVAQHDRNQQQADQSDDR